MLAVAVAAAALFATPCDLALQLGPRVGHGQDQSHVELIVVNRGLSTCRVSGYPNVELIGPPVPKWLGVVYALPQAVGSTRTIALRPGAAAHATLTWLPWGPGNPRYTPGYLHVVVPTSAGASTSLGAVWTFGPVLRQDAATHPGTYVGPLAPGR